MSSESSMHLLAAAAAVDHETSSSSPEQPQESTAMERDEAQKTRTNLEKRARASLSERQREARQQDNSKTNNKNEQESTDTEESEEQKEKKRKAEALLPAREKAAEERKKKRENKIATQDKMAAEERERRKRKDETRRAQKQAEADKLADRKGKIDKDQKEEENAAPVGLAEAITVAAAAPSTGDDTETDRKPKATNRGNEVTDNDVLLGRGGMTNQHVGNKRFRDLVLAIQPTYITQRSRAKKSEMSRTVVAQVKALGGRFMREVDGQWQEVSEDVAQKKASQALRENAKDLRNIQMEKESTAKEGNAKSGANGKSAAKKITK